MLRNGNFRLSGLRKLIALIVCCVPFATGATEIFRAVDYSGKVVVLDFWASWCVPCRRSFPWMNEMQQKYGDEGLVIVAVNLDNEAQDAAKFLQAYPADFNIAYDPERTLARDYGVEAMPSSFLIDRDGKVVERHMGFVSAKADDYEAAIVSALRNQP